MSTDVELKYSGTQVIPATCHLQQSASLTGPWDQFDILVPKDVPIDLLYRLVLYRTNAKYRDQPVETPKHIEKDYCWYNDIGADRRLVCYLQTSGRLLLVDFSDQDPSLTTKQLANLSRLLGKDEDAVGEHINELDTLRLYNLPIVNSDVIAYSAIKSVLERWQSHPTFALRHLETTAQPAGSNPLYAGINVINKFSGEIEFVLRFAADCVSINNPYTNETIRTYEYCLPTMAENIIAFIAAQPGTHQHSEPLFVTSAEELRAVAMGIIQRQIFTSRHCSPDMVRNVFMTINFMPAEYIGVLVDHEVDFFYEDISAAGPRGINGYPNFFSHRCLTRQDAAKVMQIYASLETALESALDQHEIS